jgi:hypothetical protein
MLGEQGGLAVAGLAEVVRVLLVHADARIDCGIDADHPALLLLADHDIGDDGAGLEGADLGARARIQAADQVHGDTQLVLGAAQGFQQPRVVTRGHESKAVLHNVEGEITARRIFVQRLQLQGETFTQIAGAHAAGLERLHDAQRGFQLTGLGLARHGLYFLERLAQKAILVEGLDYQVGQGVITLGQPQKQQLFVQRVM